MEDSEIRSRALYLKQILTQYQYSYYVTGRSEVPDSEYDRLFDELSAIEAEYPELKTDDSPTQRVGSDLSSDFPEVKHSIPVLSLDKAYSVSEIRAFINRCSKAAAEELSFVMEEKIDGFSVVLYYKDGLLERAVTRGNGFIGNDVTANVKTIRAVPLRLKKNLTLAVRGEVYLPKADFERINLTLEEPYANPRNLAAGTIRRIKSSDTAKVPLSMFCYEGFWEKSTPFGDHLEILRELRDLGLPVDSHLSIFCRTKEEAQKRLEKAGLEGFAGSFDEIEEDIKGRTERRKGLPYEIDGLVLKINEIRQREIMGWTEHHPKWAVAYKFEAPQAETVVRGIDVQVGRTGRITPMARIEATELSGSVIRNITLHNQDYVDSLELAVGDTVAISKRGDVIPAVESVTEKNAAGNTTWHLPPLCPSCSTPLIRRGAHSFCPNRRCPAREKGTLEFFCAKNQMDIEGLGEKTVDLLYDLNYIRRIQDIFTFNWETLLSDGVEGFGEKKVLQIEKAVKDARKAPFERLLISLGIPEFGKKAVSLVTGAGFDSMDRILQAKAEDLSGIDGIGPVTSVLITEGLHEEEMISLINDLKDMGFSMAVEKDSEKTEEEQIFSGQTWCVTGTFEHFKPREKAMEEITKRGGTEVSSVSSKTTCLLAGANAGSKLQKALSLGVRVVGEEEFLRMIRKEEKSSALPGLFD